jgi:hypothetical protein
MAEDHRWIFVILLVAALVGWKVLLRKFWPRGKE